MEPKIVSRPAFTVAGLVHRGTADGEKIAALWGQFGARMGELQPVIEPDVAYGVMANYCEDTGEFDYVAASQVSSGEGLPAGFIAVPVPESNWAVFTTTIPEMGKVYPYIYGTWLPQSGYQHGPAPEFESYGPGFDPADPTCECEIYIPIVKA
jgi:AraC family transcriptional regulator